MEQSLRGPLSPACCAPSVPEYTGLADVLSPDAVQPESSRGAFVVGEELAALASLSDATAAAEQAREATHLLARGTKSDVEHSGPHPVKMQAGNSFASEHRAAVREQVLQAQQCRAHSVFYQPNFGPVVVTLQT
ncbi:hypothetical protein CB1_000568087 [Camelus ferus]|nr:hypothetical protein CB1_000568087 [Camelus ferus]